MSTFPHTQAQGKAQLVNGHNKYFALNCPLFSALSPFPLYICGSVKCPGQGLSFFSLFHFLLTRVKRYSWKSGQEKAETVFYGVLLRA